MFVLDVLSKNDKTGGKGKMRRAEKFGNKALKAVERIARNEVQKAISGKTAECAAIWHQPKRPKTDM